MPLSHGWTASPAPTTTIAGADGVVNSGVVCAAVVGRRAAFVQVVAVAPRSRWLGCRGCRERRVVPLCYSALI